MNTTKWTKGIKSPNPAGRPKKGDSIAEQVRGAMRGAPRQRIIKRVVKLAEGGNLEATKLLWAYGYGPPPREPLVAIDLRGQGQPTEPSGDLSRLSLEELVSLRHLLAKSQGIVEPVPQLLPAPPVAADVAEIIERQPQPESAAEVTAEPEPEPEPEQAKVICIDTAPDLTRGLSRRGLMGDMDYLEDRFL